MRDSPTERETESDAQSPPVSQWLATLFALLAVPPLHSSLPVSTALGTTGAVALAAGAYRTDSEWINYGLVLQIGGVLLGGFAGVAPGPRLFATLFAVIAWDVARYGLVIDEQLGRTARTARIELTHAGSSLVVGGAGAGLCYSVYLLSTGARSFTALGFLVIGASVLTATLR